MSSASYKMLYRKPFYRILSLFLSLIIVFNLVGVSAANASAKPEQTGQKESVSPDIGEIPNKLPKTKLELPSKRTPYSTRFLNPDGSFTEDIYLEPKFYKDPSDQKWKDIDNNLKASTVKSGIVENTANDVKTFFNQQSGAGELVSVEKGGKRIALIPVQANPVNGSVQNNQITYPDLYANTDFRYQVKSSKVKEDIVLKQNTANNTYTFEIKLSGLQAVQDKNGVISFIDSKGKKLWYFEQPFMTDANDKISTDVNLVLREANGKTYVDVIADQAFLQDPNTRYPITIDPTIDDWDVLRDTFVASNFPGSSYGSLAKLYTGADPYYYGSMRSLAQFYLPSLPSDSKILSANVNLYQTQQDATSVSVDLYRVTSSWTTYATWNTQPSVGATPETTTTNNTYNQYWQWNITQLAKDWYNGVQPNYGFMLKQQNEATSPFRAFNSVNSGSNTPRLTITYWIDPIGLEDFWGYTKDGVNPANGNLVLQQNDFSIPGRGVPVSLTRTYNSRKADVAGMFGYGWISNAEARLVDAGSGPITLIDGDNTRHIFGQGAGGTYVAHGGIYLTLVKNGDGTYTITQTDGTKINFNTSGKISSIVDTNGNTTTMTYNGNGKLTEIKDASNRSTTMTYGANGYVASVQTPGSRTISYQYDANGNLTQVTDPASKTISFGYDASHQLTSITDQRNITTTIAYSAGSVASISRPITIDGVPTTSTTTYVYDFDLMVTTVTDGEGRRVDYQHNPNKNIVQITENPLDAQNKAITTFAYDNNNNLVEAKDPNTNKVSGTSAYIYTYDGNGNITKVQYPENNIYDYKYDGNNNVIEESDANSNKSNTSYDAKNNPLEAIDANRQTSASRYLTNGNMEYDTKMISSTDNLLKNPSFEKDTNPTDNWPDHWTQYVEPGKTASYAWSSTSRFGQKAVSISNPTGWALVTADAIPYEANTQYVVSGYMKTVNTTNTSLIKIEFLDNQGAPIQGYTQYSFGLKGTHDWTPVHTSVNQAPTGTTQLRVSVGMNAGSGTVTFDGIQLEKGTVVSAYNLVENAGFERANTEDWTGTNLSVNDVLDQNVNPGDDNVHSGKYAFKMTGEAGKSKHLTQHLPISGDANTKLTLSGWSKQTGASPSGGYYTLQVEVHYTGNPVPQVYANDFSTTAAGWQHVAAKINPTAPFESIDVYYVYNNQTGTAWFDAMRLETGNAFSEYTYDDVYQNYVTSVKDPIGNTVSFGYDAVGNKTGITDGKGKSTSFTYDGRNLLTQVTDANQGVTSYGYDNAGNRTTVTDANNHATTYNYNEFQQVSSITNPLNQTIQFGYDKNGNTTKLIFPKGDTVSYTHNALNRMDGVFYNGVKQWGYTYDANGNVTSVTNVPTGNSTSFTYDKNNQLKQQAEGASNQINYGYDLNNNLESMSFTAGTTTVSTGYDYNPLNQLITMSRNGTNQAKFVYDERGNVISVSYSNGTYTAYEFDDANRLSSLKNYLGDGTLLEKYAYTYDANSNITSVTTSAGTVSYQYDDLNQLTQETLLNGTTIAYAYDAVGNRTQKTVTQGGTPTTTNYTYDAGNQLTAVNGQAYTYDANGNLTGNGVKTFIYDVENRLVEVKDSANQTIATFTYDHEGKRNSMTTSGGTVFFHYSGDKVIYETDASNNVVAEYTWDAQGNPVTMTRGGVTYYYHINGHGDVTALTDASGNTVAQYQYDAWGNITSQTPGTIASSNPYRYAGYRYDEGTGLYYLMARYYDAGVGRFITKDTFHGLEDDPQSLNLYVYAKGNPVILVDPDGHNPIFAALRYLVRIGWKIGKDVVKRAWAIALPYVKKAINEAKYYTIDGPGGGGRIIQVRNIRTNSVIFRLDFYPVRTGGPFTLHYHILPNLKEHHVIFISNIYKFK